MSLLVSASKHFHTSPKDPRPSKFSEDCFTANLLPKTLYPSFCHPLRVFGGHFAQFDDLLLFKDEDEADDKEEFKNEKLLGNGEYEHCDNDCICFLPLSPLEKKTTFDFFFVETHRYYFIIFLKQQKQQNCPHRT